MKCIQRTSLFAKMSFYANMVLFYMSGIFQPQSTQRYFSRRFYVFIFFPHQELDFIVILGFPGSSVGKESTCNAGDPDLIGELGRSTGEGMDYLLQYF